MTMDRRTFLVTAASAYLLTSAGCHTNPPKPVLKPLNQQRLFFTSQGKTAVMNGDGSGLRYLAFDVPNQATWQPTAFFPDGKRVLMLSMEPRRDGPGKPFEEYYHKTPTRIWTYDLDTGALVELLTKKRLAPFCTPQLLLADGRMLIQVISEDKVAQTFNVNFDGSDPRPFTQPGEGMPYGLDLSPDGTRVAYHLAGPKGYEIRTSDIYGNQKTLVAQQAGHLYFGPKWSPDSQWLIFQDCIPKDDPGHDWSDLVLSRPDGSEQRLLTNGQALWFAATYGAPESRGGGSNMPVWSHDGTILHCRRFPESKVPWEYQVGRVDVDHFNRRFNPDAARGGTEICRLDPANGELKRLSVSKKQVWDFRQAESSDGKHILFCRAATGESPGLWICDANGDHAQLLTKGIDGLGADHPRWVP